MTFTQITGRLRDFIASISPTALSGPVGNAYEYCVGVVCDALADAASYAVQLRFPGLANAPDLAPIGADRGLAQGPTESYVSYQTRLLQWITLRRLDGFPRGILLELLAWFTPASLAALATVDDSAVYYSFPEGQALLPLPTPTRTVGTHPWIWDSLGPPWLDLSLTWWRMWVVIYPDPSLGWQNKPKCGSGIVCGSGQACGFGGTSAQARDIQSRIARRKAEHAWIVYMIFAFDSTWFQPTSGTAKLPNGKYGRWGSTQTIGGSPVYYPARVHGATASYGGGSA
jgi:hypothetical protein